MIRRATPRPVLGLVVLLLAFSVVAMHQLGAGHQPSVSAGHGMPAGHGAVADMSVGGNQSSRQMAVATEQGCGAACAVAGAHEPPLAGHGALMLCLAVLPLLLLVLHGRRRALLTRWHRVVAEIGAMRWVGRRRVADLGPPGTSLSRLCVSRT